MFFNPNSNVWEDHQRRIYQEIEACAKIEAERVLADIEKEIEEDRGNKKIFTNLEDVVIVALHDAVKVGNVELIREITVLLDKLGTFEKMGE